MKIKDHNEFQLKFIIIPIELFGNDKLNATDMHLFSFINMLDGKKGCFASNIYLANLLNVSEVTISTSINKLIKLNYINKISFDGRKRTLKINPDYLKIYKKIVDEFNEKFQGKLKDRLKANLKTDLRQTLNIKSNSIKSNSITNIISKDIIYVSKKHHKKIISIINVWNNLPNTTTHSNTNTKVYKTIYIQIENLLCGKPLIIKKDGSPTEPFLDFVESNNISRKLYSKEWTLPEINKTFQKINDTAKINNKLSLQQTFWNAFAKKRGGGFSLFLHTAMNIEFSTQDCRITSKLMDVTGKKLNSIKKTSWIKQIEVFMKEENIQENEINNLLDWYKIHKDETYTPIIDSPEELREKYSRLKQAKNKADSGTAQSKKTPQLPLKDLSPAGFPVITRSYDRKSKKRKSVQEWQAVFEANAKMLLKAPIWSPNHTPDKALVFNAVISMQQWLENVDYNQYGGANLKYKIHPLEKLINYYILCIDDWWGNWMDGIKDINFDVNSKIFKMFIREMETSFATRIPIKSLNWINDSDWKPRD